MDTQGMERIVQMSTSVLLEVTSVTLMLSVPIPSDPIHANAKRVSLEMVFHAQMLMNVHLPQPTTVTRMPSVLTREVSTHVFASLVSLVTARNVQIMMSVIRVEMTVAHTPCVPTPLAPSRVPVRLAGKAQERTALTSMSVKGRPTTAM